MELTTSQDILLRGLQKIQGIVERKNTLPILSHFLLTAQAEGAVIHATDLELGYRGSLDATVNKPGTITLPARKTYDILRELPAGMQVTLAVENQGWVRLAASATMATIVSQLSAFVRSSAINDLPSSKKCPCPSIKPGTASRPTRSMT